MDVCVVSPHSPRRVAGIGTGVVYLACSLKKRDVETTVLTPPHKGPDLIKPHRLDELCLVEPSIIDIRNLRTISFSLSLAFEIIKRRKQIDILQLHQAIPITTATIILGRALGIPVITTLHLKQPGTKNPIKNFMLNISEKITLAYSSDLIFVSKDTKRTMETSKGVVIENGIDAKYFKPDPNIRNDMRKKLNISNNEVLLIFIGRWCQAHKGIYDLLKAVSNLPTSVRHNTKLILIGYGDEITMSRKITSLGVEDIVLPIGPVNSVYEYLTAADIFILPSYREGMPLSLLEAMSCALPSIVSNVGGNAELIDDGKNGLLISPGNISELTKKIMWYIKNPEARTEAGTNARATILEKFDLDKVAERYLERYQKVMK